MTSSSMRFGFGKNWEEYIKKNFSEERVEISKKHLLAFLGLETLEGKSFLDIGCGSGLHSLAAFKAGAARIVGFDFDIDSVNTTRRLWQYAGSPAHWSVMQGSILDDQFVDRIESADIVYSWGVLHHTGSMWKAMDNAARLGRQGSLYYIALYDDDIHTEPTPEFWLEVKQRYNQSSAWEKRKLEFWYVWRFMLNRSLRNVPALVKRIIGYKQSRGMEIYTDIKDWLGGWPMEFAKRSDVAAWAAKHGLEMLTMKTGEANTEYLFKRS